MVRAFEKLAAIIWWLIVHAIREKSLEERD
jgi:hypothetical protein